MERRLIIALFIVLLLYLNFPKLMFEVDDDRVLTCECMGFSYGSSASDQKCIGLTFECREEFVEEIQTTGFTPTRIKEVCMRKTCETYENYLGIERDDPATQGIEAVALNMMIVMDTSYSMSGEKIEKTIAASKEMINALNPKDQVGVISFNTQSEIIHEFSTDKGSVVAALENVVPREYTRYVEALELARDQFVSLGDAEANDVIIFLSDGLPLENESDIIEITEELDGMGIGIYTIRIGEINQTEGPDVLEKMTNIIGEQGFYTSKNIDAIFQSFDSIIQSLVKEDDIFYMNANIQGDLVYPEDTSLPVMIQLFSSENMRVVPGFIVNESQILCVDDAKIDLVVADLEDRVIENRTMSYVAGQYITELNGIPEGEYRLKAYIGVVFENNTDCSFYDVQELGILNVTTVINESCQELTCNDIVEIMKDQDFAGEIPDQDTGKRVLFSIDTSASMNDEGKLLYAKNAIKRMVSRFGTAFSFGLVAFNDQAELVQRFTADKRSIYDHLDGLVVSGTTNYIPPLKKARGLLGTDSFDPNRDISSDVLIFISDGIPWDKGRPGSILDYTERLIDRGVCIFTIGYGSEVTTSTEQVLKRMAGVSERRLGCGAYFYSTPSETDLDRILKSIYSDIVTEGDLVIRPKLNTQQFTQDDTLTMFSRVYSSYNSMQLPTVDNRFCEMDTRVVLKEMDAENRSIVDIHLEFAPDLGFHTIAQSVDKEAVSLRLEASIYDYNDTKCSTEGVRSIPVRMKESNGDEDRYRFYLKLSSIMINLFLIVIMSYSLIFILQERKPEVKQ